MLVADGNHLCTLTATLNDSFGNPVANQNVSFSGIGTNNAFVSTAAVTNAQGMAQTGVRSTLAQSQTFVATFSGGSVTSPVTFVAGPATTVNSKVVATPNRNVAGDNTGIIALSLSAADAYGNPVPSQAVALTATGAGGSNSFASASGTTDGNGMWASTWRSTTAATKVVTATMGSAVPADMVVFVPGVASASTSSLVINPNTGILPNGQAAAALTAYLVDATYNPIVGARATFSASGIGNNIAPVAIATQSTGIAKSVLTATVPQAQTVTVRIAGLTLNANVTFANGPSNCANTQLLPGLPTPYDPNLAGNGASAVGDFNNDGFWDVVCNTSNANVNFTTAKMTNFSTALSTINSGIGAYDSAKFFALGDFDPDGRLDLVVNPLNTNQIYLMSGNADCTFTANSNYLVASSHTRLYAGDIDNDGMPDVVAGLSASTVSTLFNKGRGVFQASQSTSIGSGS